MSVKVGIVGVTGYTGGELIRLLLNHPEAQVVAHRPAAMWAIRFRRCIDNCLNI